MIKTPVKPTVRKIHGIFRIFIFRTGRGAFIKCHHNISTDNSFYIHHFFWCEQMPAAIYVTLKKNTFFVDFPVCSKGKYLKAATVRQQWLLPIHKTMQATTSL